MLLLLKSEDCHHQNNQTFILHWHLKRFQNTKKLSRQSMNSPWPHPKKKKKKERKHYRGKRKRHTIHLEDTGGFLFSC